MTGPRPAPDAPPLQVELTLLDAPIDYGPSPQNGPQPPAEPPKAADGPARPPAAEAAGQGPQAGGQGGEDGQQSTGGGKRRRKPAPAAFLDDKLTEHEAAAGFARVYGAELAWTDCDDGHERGRWWKWSPEATRWKIAVGPPSHEFYGALAVAGEDKWKVSTVESCLRHARRRMHVPMADWDADPRLLGHPDGTATELATGQRRQQTPEDRVRRTTGVDPDANPEAAAWVRARLLELTCGRPRLVDFILRTLGAACIGANADQLIHFWTGGGSNGKSTLLGAASAALGDYAVGASKSLLSNTGMEDHPTHLAAVIGPGASGPRLITAAEPDHTIPWSEDMLKALTGNDKLSARRMRQDYSEGFCVGEVVVAVNTLPELREINYAITRRIKVTPFDARFVDGVNRDLSMAGQWERQRGALLHLMIEAARRVVAEHDAGAPLQAPPEVETSSRRYIEQHQAMEVWAAECLEARPAGSDAHYIEKDEAMHAFANWCHANGFATAGAEWQDRRGKRGLASSITTYFNTAGDGQVKRRDSQADLQARVVCVAFKRHLSPVPAAGGRAADPPPNRPETGADVSEMP